MSLKKIIPIVIIVVFALLQFFVKKDNVSSYESVSHFEQKTQLPQNVKSIFRESCYDCHSNHTQYPWYASIGLVNLLIAHDIEEGKEHLNFSDWNTYSAKKQLHKLAEVYEEVEEGEMPLKIYRITHGGLSETQKASLLQWSKIYKEH